MRLLLIEDDKTLAAGVAAALGQSGYEVDLAGTARSAMDLARAREFIAGILDLGLPDRDGIDLLRELRQAGVAFPILVLSARDGLNDRIRGLDTGADDYLVKPFALGELEARLRALLRRREEHGIARQMGSLRFDRAARQAWAGERALVLGARESALLDCLVAKPRKIVPKHVLFAAVFPDDTAAAMNALEVHVSRLRHKLRPAGVTIRSVRGLGYRLEESAAADERA